MTDIKLSPAMVTALKRAEIVGGRALVPTTTKVQTIKGLESRGLSDSAGELTSFGVEAARQLGAEVVNLGEKGFEFGVTGPDTTIEVPEELLEGNPEGITPDMVTQAAQNLLKTPEQLAQAVDLDKPHVVPNRADNRKVRFQLKGALSRLKERNRVKRMNKYGSVPETFAA